MIFITYKKYVVDEQHQSIFQNATVISYIFRFIVFIYPYHPSVSSSIIHHHVRNSITMSSGYHTPSTSAPFLKSSMPWKMGICRWNHSFICGCIVLMIFPSTEDITHRTRSEELDCARAGFVKGQGVDYTVVAKRARCNNDSWTIGTLPSYCNSSRIFLSRHYPFNDITHLVKSPNTTRYADQVAPAYARPSAVLFVIWSKRTGF